jgi:hypothetical protein
MFLIKRNLNADLGQKVLLSHQPSSVRIILGASNRSVYPGKLVASVNVKRLSIKLNQFANIQVGNNVVELRVWNLDTMSGDERPFQNK